MEPQVTIIEDSKVGFSSIVCLGRNSASHFGFTDKSQASRWSEKMVRKIQRQALLLKENCAPHEYDS